MPADQVGYVAVCNAKMNEHLRQLIVVAGTTQKIAHGNSSSQANVVCVCAFFFFFIHFNCCCRRLICYLISRFGFSELYTRNTARNRKTQISTVCVVCVWLCCRATTLELSYHFAAHSMNRQTNWTFSGLPCRRFNSVVHHSICCCCCCYFISNWISR